MKYFVLAHHAIITIQTTGGAIGYRMIISRTPLRLSFCGGGSDYPQFYLNHAHGGAILGGSIDKYCYVVLHDGRSNFFFDLPNKSGLASSSAYTVGLLRACCDFDTKTLARLATTWEQDKTNGQVGSQDQYLCAVGGFHHLKFSEQGIRDIPVSQEVVRPLEDYLMLFDTHQYRVNGNIIPAQLKEMEQHAELYERMAEMPQEGVILLEAQDYCGFGELLHEAWETKRQLSKTISTQMIDDIYAGARHAGAIGGKLLGGGGGGFIIFLVEPEKQEAVKKILGDLTHVPFHFENEGSRVIYRD